jgi:hypothetical protein
VEWGPLPVPSSTDKTHSPDSTTPPDSAGPGILYVQVQHRSQKELRLVRLDAAAVWRCRLTLSNPR